MHYEYSRLASLTPAEYAKKMKSIKKKAATKSDSDDLKRIERLLDLREGVLAEEDFYVSKADCKCGRRLTFYDLVLTSLTDSGHSKSFVVHTLLGSKYFAQPTRQVKCSACGEVHLLDYETDRYGCCRE